MAIKVYTGRMGSGKTYEVVTVVILGALRHGRRVVSNIAGLNFEEMRCVLLADGVDESAMGSIVQIGHEAVTAKGFWKTDGSQPSFIEPGDLLVLDEVWRFYDGFSQPPEPVLNFFRMHRHFVHAQTGQTCDVALITQDIADIGRKIRPVVEETYYMEKLTALGSARHYRVDIYSGAKKSRDHPVRSIQRTYNLAYFCLYQSHSQKSEESADAMEVNIDERGNILKSTFFRLGVPAALLVLGFSVYRVIGFFTPEPPAKPKAQTAPAAASPSSPSPSPSSPSLSPAAVLGGLSAKVSVLLATARPRLVYSGRLGERSFHKVEFLSGASVLAVYSDDELFLAGWRIFYSADGRSALLSNGADTHVVEIRLARTAIQKERLQ